MDGRVLTDEVLTRVREERACYAERDLVCELAQRCQQAEESRAKLLDRCEEHERARLRAVREFNELVRKLDAIQRLSK